MKSLLAKRAGPLYQIIGSRFCRITLTGRLFFSGDSVLATNRCYVLDVARTELGDAAAAALAAAMAQRDEQATLSAANEVARDPHEALNGDGARAHHLPCPLIFRD